MKTVGQMLREARESKGLTIGQAAEGTRSKTQIIQALEQDDYSRFPAPIYTRGFIKLYAEFLGLNAPELISLYQARNLEADKLHRPASVLKPSSSHPPAPVLQAAPELDLPPPAPVASPETVASPTPPPVAEVLQKPAPPAAQAPELPFDAPAAEKMPSSELPPLFPPAPKPPPMKPAQEHIAPPHHAPVPEPPKVAPVLPEAPRQPMEPAIPRKKVVVDRPPSVAEFDLTVRDAVSAARKHRAASLLAAAQASAVRLPWRKIAIRLTIGLVALLLIWLLFSTIRGCAARHAQDRRVEPAAPAFHAVPEPPPLYFPDR